MNVILHIERLILDGVEGAALDERALQAAVAAELTRLLTEGGLHPELTAGGARASVRGGTIQTPGKGEANALGPYIAQAVYGGIGK